jgi:predicted ATPase/DNA-binding SARP family transcriptional activator
MSRTMRIDVLGPVRVVRHDGVDVTPRPAQQRQALAALVAAGPTGMTTGDLTDLLWPAGAPSANALQAVISKLRKVVAPLEVALVHGRYVLLGDVTTDLAELERAHADADWEQVESLVRGPVLAELEADPLAESLRRRVAAMRSTARYRVLESVALGPEPDLALAELEALTTAEPVDERWWALMMTAHYRAGNQAAALDAYQRAREALAQQLGLEPGPELRRLERQVLDHAAELDAVTTAGARAVPGPPLPEAPRQRTQLPARLASFIGRGAELDELTGILAGHRLVTLLGPGGVGKTTTALELARAAPDAAFVELAPQADRDSIVRAFTRAVGLPDIEQVALGGASTDPVERLIDALHDRSLVLVVDNCEHVVDDAAAVVHRLLAACEDVRMIATSRQALGVPGEYVYVLPSLPRHDAVELFVARAQARAAGAAVALAAPAQLAELCARLDDLPLAIELAAARLRTTTVDELIERLDDRFALLSAGARTVQPRQQTLRAVVDWSHDLLDDAERVVFRRLAAFVGGASPEAARAVCAGPAPDGVTVEPSDVDEIVQRLADKSLVVVEHDAIGSRWGMLETLRDYAAERLSASGENERVHVRHARHFATFLEPAMRGLVGPEQRTWFARVRRERRNLDVALATALAAGEAQLALELTMPLGWYFWMVGELDTGVAALGEALACSGPTDPTTRAGALGLYGWLLANTPEVAHAMAATDEAKSLLDRVTDPFVRGLVACTNVMSLFFAGHLDLVEAEIEVLGTVVADIDDPWIRAITDLVEGEVLQYRGEPAAAERAFLRAAAAFERQGDQFGYALAVTEASEIAEMIGDYDRAAEMLRHGLALADEVGFSGHPLAMRARLANIEILRGDLSTAERLHRALLDDPRATGMHWVQAMALLGLASIDRRRGDLDSAGEHLERAWTLSRTQTVPYMRAIASVARGYLADQRGDAQTALAVQREGLRTALLLRHPRGIAYAIEGVAGALSIAGVLGSARLGARLLGLADRLRADSGGRMPAAERFDVDRTESRLRDALGDAQFAACFAAGEAAPVDPTIDEVMAVDLA